MQAVRKIINVRNNMISIDGLKELNNKLVEIIIIPFPESKKKSSKKELLKFCGIGKSGYKDTSRKIDEIIYGK